MHREVSSQRSQPLVPILVVIECAQGQAYQHGHTSVCIEHAMAVVLADTLETPCTCVCVSADGAILRLRRHFLTRKQGLAQVKIEIEARMGSGTVGAASEIQSLSGGSKVRAEK